MCWGQEEGCRVDWLGNAVVVVESAVSRASAGAVAPSHARADVQGRAGQVVGAGAGAGCEGVDWCGAASLMADGAWAGG